MSPPRALIGDDRGASEVVGYVLLIGLVITATGVAVVMGSQAIGGLQAENEATAATAILEEVDAELTTLAASSDAPTTTFDFGSTAGGSGGGGSNQAGPVDGSPGSVSESLAVRRGGSVNVTIVEPAGNRCTAISTLGTVRFERSGRVVAYEGGGIWSGTSDGGSAMISPPDISFRGGSLDIQLLNVSGSIDGGRTDAEVNRVATRRNNTRHRSKLQRCDQVEEVHLTVNSTFHRAWGEYLGEQTGVTPTQVGERSVRVELGSGELPLRADMANNTVVNTTNPSYMTENGGSGFTPGSDRMTVDKAAGNSYLVSVESLSQRPPQISQVRELSADNISNRQRPPVDVVFVMDESGSMQIGSYGGSSPDDENRDGDYVDPGERAYEAQEAAKTAIGTMNTTIIGDRASIVGYEAYPQQRYITKGGRRVFFSNDSTKLNNTIEGLQAQGSTDISSGLNQSLAALSYRDQRREAHVILMSDGQNQPGRDKCGEWGYSRGSACTGHFNDRTMNGAEIAANRDVTVHTFSFGSGADRRLLERVADATGGNYSHAATGDELKEAFQSTIGGFTNRREYATRTPLTTNFTGGGEVHPPQIVGDTDPVASTTGAGGETFLNINDPTAPTLFSHSFRVDEGDPVVINATKFDCADDGWADTGEAVDTGSRTLPVARCTDIVATNESLEDTRIEFYQDGDGMTPLMTNDAINQTLEQYNDSTAASRFDLASNEMIINLNFEAQGEFENNLILRYEIGLSEAEVNGADVVNLQETVVELG